MSHSVDYSKATIGLLFLGKPYERYHRPQTQFAKVMFLQVSVCPQGGRTCHMTRGAGMVAGGMHARGGMCARRGDMHGWGACIPGGVRG